MAEGGDFGMDQPDLDHDDDDDDDEQEANRTQPFSLAQHPPPTMVVNNMKCKLCSMNRAEIPLLGGFIHQDDKPVLFERARAFIKNKFPKIDFRKLGPIGFSKKPGNETTIVSFGTKGGETDIFGKMGKVFSKNSQTSSKHPLVQKLNL